jgi:tetratricopeptide (TPR) repeat protein
MRWAFFTLVVACACGGRAHATEPAPLPLPTHAAATPSATAASAPTAPGEHTAREWVALGDEAFAQARLVDATRFYLEAVREDGEVTAYAWYKLGFIRWNQNDGPAALEAFLHAIRSADAHHDARIARSARIDIVAVYAQYGRPSAAFDFFRAFSPSPIDALGSLGQQYVDDGKWDAARAVYAELAARDVPNACAHHVRESAAADAARGSAMAAPPEIAARIARCR